MVSIIAFILFLAYTVVIFFIKKYYILGIIFIINNLLILILKINIKKSYIAILKLMPIIIFTSTINIAISGLSYGLLIGFRLILVCHITYIFSKKITPQKLQYIIETLLKPLKVINIDSKEIGIMVCICITFIPILQREITDLKYALKSKGFELKFKNIIKNPNYILTPLMTMTIKRVGEIENSLLSKGYMEGN